VRFRTCKWFSHDCEVNSSVLTKNCRSKAEKRRSAVLGICLHISPLLSSTGSIFPQFRAPRLRVGGRAFLIIPCYSCCRGLKEVCVSRRLHPRHSWWMVGVVRPRDVRLRNRGSTMKYAGWKQAFSRRANPKTSGLIAAAGLPEANLYYPCVPVPLLKGVVCSSEV
jgi:hypothetical protein